MEQRYGTEVWNDPSRRYGTGVWNGGMERVWSRSLFRTSYFDLPPNNIYTVYILHNIYLRRSLLACPFIHLSNRFFSDYARICCPLRGGVEHSL